MSLVTQFQSKQNIEVLRQIESDLTDQNQIFRNPGRHVAGILQSWVEGPDSCILFILFMNPFYRNSFTLQLFNMNPPPGDVS
jgi:hypothetical protein